VKTNQNFSEEPVVLPLGERGQIKVSNVIHGFLPFNKESNIAVKDVSIFLEGIEQSIATVDVVIDEDGARFEFTIDSIARAGMYRIVWNTFISGVESKVTNNFSINSDSIDRSLPLELQHLR